MRFQVIIASKGKEHNIFLEDDTIHAAWERAVAIAQGEQYYVNEEGTMMLDFPADNTYEYIELVQVLELIHSEAPEPRVEDELKHTYVPFKYLGNSHNMSVTYRQVAGKVYAIIQSINGAVPHSVLNIRAKNVTDMLYGAVMDAIPGLNATNIAMVPHTSNLEEAVTYLYEFIANMQGIDERAQKTAVAVNLKDEEDK